MRWEEAQKHAENEQKPKKGTEQFVFIVPIVAYRKRAQRAQGTHCS